MNRKKYYIPVSLFFVLLLISCSTSSNISKGQITENVSTKQKRLLFRNSALLFDLPSDQWFFGGELEINKRTSYEYFRVGLFNKDGKIATAFFTINYEDVSPDMELNAYSIMKRNQLSRCDVKKVFTHEDGLIKIKNALGFVGTYTGIIGEKHTVIVVHAINNNVGYQIIIDSTSEIPAVEKEFYFILNHLAFVN